MALDAFEKLPREKQERILNACMEVFANHEYKHASTDDMAARANISKGMLFYYFHNKRDLCAYLFQYAIGVTRRRMWELAAFDREDFFDLLAQATRIKGQIMAEHPALYDFLMRAYYEADPAVAGLVRDIRDVGLSRNMDYMLERLPLEKFREGIDPRLALKLVLWSAEGYMKLQKDQGTAGDLDAIVNEYMAAMELLKRAFYKEEYL